MIKSIVSQATANLLWAMTGYHQPVLLGEDEGLLPTSSHLAICCSLDDISKYQQHPLVDTPSGCPEACVEPVSGHCFCIPGMSVSFWSVAGIPRAAAGRSQEVGILHTHLNLPRGNNSSKLLPGKFSSLVIQCPLPTSCCEVVPVAPTRQFLFSMVKAVLLSAQTLWSPMEAGNGAACTRVSWQGFLGLLWPSSGVLTLHNLNLTCPVCYTVILPFTHISKHQDIFVHMLFPQPRLPFLMLFCQ